MHLRISAFRKSTSEVCSIVGFSAGSRCGWPKPSSPTTLLSRDGMTTIRFKDVTCSERPGSCPRYGLIAVASVRRLSDDTIRAGDVAVTTIRPHGTRERPRTFFGSVQLAIVVEAAHIPI